MTLLLLMLTTSLEWTNNYISAELNIQTSMHTIAKIYITNYNCIFRVVKEGSFHVEHSWVNLRNLPDKLKCYTA